MGRTGRCLCGAVTFTCSDVDEIDCCHCDMCRRWAGGPFFAVRGQFFINGHALDDQSGLDFTLEVFIDEKPPFYEFSNETKRMTSHEVIAAFIDGQR